MSLRHTRVLDAEQRGLPFERILVYVIVPFKRGEVCRRWRFEAIEVRVGEWKIDIQDEPDELNKFQYEVDPFLVELGATIF